MARQKEDFLLESGECPACGSADVTSDNIMPPMKCNACGWRGWSELREDDD